MISVVVPVYKNSENIPALLAALQGLRDQLASPLEVVCVVDGSPDDSYLQLASSLPKTGLRSQLLLLSRNFGSFAAIRAGLAAARGERFAVLAADLQEPPELIAAFDRKLSAGGCDVVIGRREGRADPLSSRVTAGVFWWLYRRFVLAEIPPGGVDVFGCTKAVRDQLLALSEQNSSLLGLLFWVGFRREAVGYLRRERVAGVSAWTFAKKLAYLMDSVFSFTDLPIKLLLRFGALGLLLSVALSAAVLTARLSGSIAVPGYAATVLTVTFFGALNCFGLGVLGGYVWRTFENTKQRPGFIVASAHSFGESGAPAPASATKEGTT
jgi:glycosyltransferase involved in cell wall biosynthesis